MLLEISKLKNVSLDDLLSWEEEITKDELQKMINSLKNSQLEYPFIMEIWMVINSDDDIDEDERELAEFFCEKLKITKYDLKYIEDLINAFENNNINKVNEIFRDDNKIKYDDFVFLYEY